MKRNLALVRLRRRLNVEVLPGEPLDGTGKVCIHLFVQDPHGPFVEPHVLYETEPGKLGARKTRGRIACSSKIKGVAAVVRGGVTYVTHRTDDPRAVTCPKCIASADHKELMAVLAAKEARR